MSTTPTPYIVKLHPFNGLVSLAAVIVTAVMVYRLGWDGTKITWTWGLIVLGVLIAAAIMATGVRILSVEKKHTLSTLAGIALGAGLVATFFALRSKFGSGTAWLAIIVLVLIAADVASSLVRIIRK